MWQRRNVYAYTMRVMPSNGWVTLLIVALAAAAGAVLLAVLVAMLALAATAALLVGGAWLAWQVTRPLREPRRAPAAGRIGREVRGLLEIAATPDPLEQYLLAVREFERISAAALALAPETAGRPRTARRAWELAEQAQNLDDAVTEIERRLDAHPAADGARAHVWELALAAREVEAYLSAFAAVRRAPSLAQVRALVSRRAAMTARRTALVDRLDAVQVTRALSGQSAV